MFWVAGKRLKAHTLTWSQLYRVFCDVRWAIYAMRFGLAAVARTVVCAVNGEKEEEEEDKWGRGQKGFVVREWKL